MKTTFSAEEDAYIKANYLSLPIKRIAKNIKRSGCGVRGRLKALGLVIPKELTEQRKKNSQFSRGHNPFNKGMKIHDYMSAEGIANSAKTRFKTGNVPHNTKSDGEISVRKDSNGNKYYYIRIQQGVWEFLHRFIWERENGKIPSGMNVVFKDLNRSNCSIENLELISNQELMSRNTISQWPAELKEAIKSLNQLKKQIKNG